MADKVILEAEIKSNVGEVAKGIDEATKSTKNLAKQTEKVDKATDKAKGGFKGMGTAIKGMGTALKAAGIGLALALIAKLMEVFGKNQKVVDFFNTSMTALSIAFNDLFRFVENNIGAITGYFKDIFENPKDSLEDFANAIKDNLIERFQSMLDMIGHLGKAIGHLFKGEFAEAKEEAVNAGKEMVDVWTGVDDSVDKVAKTVKTATKAVIDYTKSTVDQATAITETTKAAEKSAVIFAKLNAEFLRDAELQRQIRDDETKTFAERIKANEDLSKVLEDQQKLQREQLDVQEKAAQLQFNNNKSDENWIALQEAKVAKLELEETITGQLSEQKTNQVALEKELLETQNEVRAEGLSGMERELAELETSYKLKLEMARKSGEDTTAIDKQFAKQKSDIIREQVNTQLEAFSGLAGALGALAGESKELAIAEAIISTFVGANKAFAQGGVAGFVTGAAVIASGLANVQKIMSTDVGGGGGGGSAGAAPQTPAPQMMSGAFTLGGGIEPEPARAYVVSDDITNNQNKLAIIRRRATI
jgi:hypothetical protein